MKYIAYGIAITTAIAAGLLIPSPIRGQPQAAAKTPLTFEAASVKPSPPQAPGRGGIGRVVRGGPGSSDPGLATFENMDLFSLVTMAYGVQRYQLAGPEWLGAARFEITARIPPGATRDQYRLMLQSLLAERFKLALHHETREIQIYELVVARNRPKLKESAVDPAADDDGLQPPPLPSSPPRGYNGPVNLQIDKLSIERLAALLAGQLGQPVTDGTGLKGRYDIKLHWSGLQAPGASEPPGTAAGSADPHHFRRRTRATGAQAHAQESPLRTSS